MPILYQVVGGILLLLVAGVLSALFTPKIILSRANSILDGDNEMLRKTVTDYKETVEREAAAKLEMARKLHEVNQHYMETRDALAEQARRHRNEIGWLKEEFFRATNKYPAPMPAGYSAAFSTP